MRSQRIQGSLPSVVVATPCDRSARRAVALSVVLLVAGLASRGPHALAAGPEQTRLEAPTANSDDERIVSDPVFQQLNGEDGESTLFAKTFLEEIVEGEEPTASRYEKLLQQLLDPQQVTRSRARVRVAQRLVDAMSYSAGQGRAFPGGQERVLALVGIGPESLRRAVREALVRFVQLERRQQPTTPSATFEALCSRLASSDAPKRDLLRDASEVLWRIDGKSLLRCLMEGLLKNMGEGQVAPGAEEAVAGYVIEIRERYRISFRDPAAWRDWWAENRDRSLEVILLEAQRAEDRQRVELWNRVVQRIKDAADPQRYLATLRDTFQLDVSRELRLAVLMEFAGFPAWLRDTPFGEAGLGAEARTQLMTEALQFLLDVIRGSNGFRFVSLEVKTAAVSALGSYQELFGDGSAELRQRVAAALHEDLEAQDPMGAIFWDALRRRYALELIRTVRSVRVADDGIHEFLKELLSSSNEVIQSDPELLAEAVSTLGRLLATPELGSSEAVNGGVELLLSIYHRHRGRDEKPWRDLRKACVSALNIPVPEPGRTAVRQLYAQVLESPDAKAERIPAIVGLGILAQVRDTAAAEILVDVLRSRERFDVGEVVSVINSLAYLGGQEALARLIEFVVVKEAAFADPIWKRTLSLVTSGDDALLTWFVERLELAAMRLDSAEYVRVIVRLCDEPALRDRFSLASAKADDLASSKLWWQRMRVVLRSRELLGQTEACLDLVKGLREFLMRNEKLAAELTTPANTLSLVERRLRAGAEVARLLGSESSLAADEFVARVINALEQLTQLRSTANGFPGGDVTALLARWQALTWLRLRLEELGKSAASGNRVAAILADLSRPERAALFEGLPQGMRARYLAALDKIVAALRNGDARPADAEDAGEQEAQN